jgi:hypothetical protein
MLGIHRRWANDRYQELTYTPMQGMLPISKSYIKPLLCTVISQIMLVIFTGLMADFGMMLTWTIKSIWTFWAVMALIVIRRKSCPTQGDLRFVMWGFWVIAFIYILAGQHIYGYVQRVILNQ